ncbi:hypothetical protein LMG31884_14510 [Xanthomonas hydrangeae]|nr:hypothetical protein LMG31884_14510 [Xanthomonas hydrangeae]CAD7715077.1 hypothetical protein LMG31884_14510 [Xanthomonas hydrangeae]
MLMQWADILQTVRDRQKGPEVSRSGQLQAEADHPFSWLEAARRMRRLGAAVFQPRIGGQLRATLISPPGRRAHGYSIRLLQRLAASAS